MDNRVDVVRTLIQPNSVVPGKSGEKPAVTVADPKDGWIANYRGDVKLIKSPFQQGTTGVAGNTPPLKLSPMDGGEVGAVSEKAHGWRRKLMGSLALGLAGFGAFAGLAPSVAMAAPPPQTSQTTTVTHASASTTDTRVRSQAPVHVQNVQQVVDQFNNGHQLYVVGHPALNGTPLSAADMQRWQEVLKGHPDTYVVLVNQTDNEAGDDMTLSRGIVNSSQFQAVTNPDVGRKDGVCFMIYYNVNGDASTRAIHIRGEELPDALNVGEQNFANPDGSPKVLMGEFVDAFKNQGKDIPGSLEVVMNHIDTTINQYAQQTVGAASTSVQGAHTALDGLASQTTAFQHAHGAGGGLGSPDITGWRAQLTQADTALKNKDFKTATTLSGNVTGAVHTQEQAMAAYEQAPGIAQGVTTQLTQVKGELGSLTANAHTTAANQHFQEASKQMEAYHTAYAAKDPNFNTSLQAARTESSAAQTEAAASASETQALKTTRNVAAATVTLALLATGIIMNRRAAAKGKKAQGELDEAMKEIGDKSADLMKLLDTADFHEVAGYEGKTKELADQLRENVVQALTLVGGANKFLAEAGGLVHNHGLANFFLTGNYNKAIDLLTNPETKLQFGFNDSSRAVMEKGSKAATWRDQLIAQGTTREFEKSLKDVLLAMADSRDAAQKNLTEIDSKGSEITGYLDKVQTSANGAQEKSKALQASAPDGLFAAPAVTTNLIPMVSDAGGLIPKGRALSAHNFVEAWDNYATPAERMANEAGLIVALGEDGRKNLVPTISKADTTLHPFDVKTDWAHDNEKKLSDQLNETANKALRTTVATDVDALHLDMEKLQTRVNTVVSQDKQRREVSPGLITNAEQDVDTARKDVAAQLKQAGAFKSGTPEQVLREPKLDPTDRTKDAHTNLDAVKPRLDVGDVETAGSHLKNIDDLTHDAHRLVGETRQALKDYPATLAERQQRTTSIDGSIASKYAPSLKRIQQGYTPDCQRLVAPEVGAGDTIANNIDQSQALLKQARGLTTDSQVNFDKAYLLTSRDELSKTDSVLKDSQGRLDGVTKAEQILADRQRAVESNLGALDGRFGTTRSNARAEYVRDHARQLLNQAEGNLQEARGSVSSTPKNPYRADQSLGVAENVRTQVERAIQADHQAFDAARSAIANAQSSVVGASGAIASAASQSWSWSNAQGSASASVSSGDLAGAYAEVATAEGYVQRAQGLLQGQDYEAAASTANSAQSAASGAVGAAESAVSSARSRFESRKSELIERQREEDERRAAEERAAQERRDEERRAEERREEESRRASSSGSSGGSWSGGGGSGSTGGHF